MAASLQEHILRVVQDSGPMTEEEILAELQRRGYVARDPEPEQGITRDTIISLVHMRDGVLNDESERGRLALARFDAILDFIAASAESEGDEPIRPEHAHLFHAPPSADAAPTLPSAPARDTVYGPLTADDATVLGLMEHLCAGIPKAPAKRGRPRVPPAEIVYLVGARVYMRLSGREMAIEAINLRPRGWRPLGHTAYERYLAGEDMTPVFTALLAESAAVQRDERDYTRIERGAFQRDYHKKTWVEVTLEICDRTGVIVALAATTQSTACGDGPTVSKIKRHLGHAFMSRMLTSQMNELVLMCLCHNLMLLSDRCEAPGARPPVFWRSGWPAGVDVNKCGEGHGASAQSLEKRA
jgi:hypothetical protein